MYESMGSQVILEQLPPKLSAKWGSSLFIWLSLGNVIVGVFGYLWHSKDPNETGTLEDIGVYL